MDQPANFSLSRSGLLKRFKTLNVVRHFSTGGAMEHTGEISFEIMVARSAYKCLIFIALCHISVRTLKQY